MNPDLIRAARLVYLAQQRASASGVALSPGDLDAFVRRETGGKYSFDDAQSYLSKHMTTFDPGITPRNVGRSLAQGVLGDWADELLGKLPESLGGGQAAEEEMRLNQALYHKAHPTADTIGKVAGGVGAGVAFGAFAPEIAILSRLGKAGTVANAAIRGAAGGAAFGAVSGAGEGETASERLHGAGTGAVVGGATGGILGGAAGTIARLTPAARAARRMANAVEESGGSDALRAANAEAVAAGRGDETIAGDLSPATQMLTRFAANNNPNTYVKAAETLNARQPNMSERLLNDVTDLLHETPNAGKRAEELAASKSSFASSPEGYEGLRDSGAVFAPGDVAPFLKEPSVESAWKLARRAGDITKGSPLDELFAKLSASNPEASPEMIRKAMGSEALSGVVPDGERAITFEDMHQFKQLLDDKAASSFAKGQGQLGKAYATVRDAVRKAMIEKVPGYAAVDAKYASMSKMEKILQQGVEAFNRTGARELASDVAQMSPEELQHFRTGLASKLVDSLRDARTNRDVAKQLMDASISMQEKLKIVFGDESTFNQFMHRVKVEARMAKTKAAIGGSQTHLLGADAEFDPLPHIPSLVHNPMGPFSALIQHTLGRVSKNQTAKVADMVGDKVLTQGSGAVERLLQELEQAHPLLGPRVTGALSGASGLLFH